MGWGISDLLTKARESLQNGSGRILVFQTAFVGDVILLTGLLRAAKKAFPKAELGVVVLPECAELVAGWGDRTFTIAKHGKNAQAEWNRLSEQLKEFKVSVALVPHRSARSARFLKALEIPVRIGFDKDSGRWWHTHKVAYPLNKYEGHRNLALLEALFPTSDSGMPELHLSEEAKLKAINILTENDLADSPFVVIAPGSIWKTKRWPLHHFMGLSEMLFRLAGLKTVVIGSKSDRILGDFLKGDYCVNLAGKLSLVESAAVIEKSRLAITCDSAPAHLATAVGVRQLVIFGSTAPRFGFMPPVPTARAIGVEMWCRPCTDHGRNSCPRSSGIPCLDLITPEDVVNTIKDWLSRRV